jgi:hypothetical protein
LLHADAFVKVKGLPGSVNEKCVRDFDAFAQVGGVRALWEALGRARMALFMAKKCVDLPHGAAHSRYLRIL